MLCNIIFCGEKKLFYLYNVHINAVEADLLKESNCSILPVRKKGGLESLYLVFISLI